MALEIQWTKRAEGKLDDIIEYLNSEWGEIVIISFFKKLNVVLENLSLFPEIGTIEKPAKKIRGLLIINRIKLFYRIKKDKIIILDLFDNKQNPNKKIF